MPMASPLCPTIAITFLYHFKNKCLDNYPIDSKPMINETYVSDIFLPISFIQLFIFCRLYEQST